MVSENCDRVPRAATEASLRASMTDARISRRDLLTAAVGALGAHAAVRSGLAQGPVPAVPSDPTKIPGAPTSELGQRSPFERPRRIPIGRNQGTSLTPLQNLRGIVTPADLHFERHHAGVPAIDPQRYKLLVHGMVERPTVFDLEALTRFPSVSRLHFLECSGNGTPSYRNIRPEQGYPARLVLPGWEGNANVKWIRRIEIADRPFQTREETSKYTDPLADDTARQFSFVMDAKSIITFPAYPVTLPDKGWWEISGISWSGRGRITRVDVSTDGGRRWAPAEVQQPALPKCHTRFRYLWNWDGRETMLLSRAVDDTGYVQPTLDQLRTARGLGTSYHFNHIRAWQVRRDGTVVFGLEG